MSQIDLIEEEAVERQVQVTAYTPRSTVPVGIAGAVNAALATGNGCRTGESAPGPYESTAATAAGTVLVNIITTPASVSRKERGGLKIRCAYHYRTACTTTTGTTVCHRVVTRCSSPGSYDPAIADNGISMDDDYASTIRTGRC